MCQIVITHSQIMSDLHFSPPSRSSSKPSKLNWRSTRHPKAAWALKKHQWLVGKHGRIYGKWWEHRKSWENDGKSQYQRDDSCFNSLNSHINIYQPDCRSCCFVGLKLTDQISFMKIWSFPSFPWEYIHKSTRNTFQMAEWPWIISAGPAMPSLIAMLGGVPGLQVLKGAAKQFDSTIV